MVEPTTNGVAHHDDDNTMAKLTLPNGRSVELPILKVWAPPPKRRVTARRPCHMPPRAPRQWGGAAATSPLNRKYIQPAAPRGAPSQRAAAHSCLVSHPAAPVISRLRTGRVWAPLRGHPPPGAHVRAVFNCFAACNPLLAAVRARQPQRRAARGARRLTRTTARRRAAHAPSRAAGPPAPPLRRPACATTLPLAFSVSCHPSHSSFLHIPYPQHRHLHLRPRIHQHRCAAHLFCTAPLAAPRSLRPERRARRTRPARHACAKPARILHPNAQNTCAKRMHKRILKTNAQTDAQTDASNARPPPPPAASCQSSITYIDGAAGELLYRGHPIEQIADKVRPRDLARIWHDQGAHACERAGAGRERAGGHPPGVLAARGGPGQA